MHQLMTDLHEGNRKALPCGAGVGLLAVDKDGGLNLCHRFTGSDLPLFGDVKTGIDKKPRLAEFIEKRLDRSGTGCEPAASATSVRAAATMRATPATRTRPTPPTITASCCATGWSSGSGAMPASRSRTRRFSTPTFRPGGARDHKHLKSINKKARLLADAVEDGTAEEVSPCRRSWAAPRRPIRMGSRCLWRARQPVAPGSRPLRLRRSLLVAGPGARHDGHLPELDVGDHEPVH